MIATTTALAFLGAPETDSDLVAAIVSRATDTLARDLGFYLGTPTDREYRAHGSRFGLPPVVEIIVPDDVLEPTAETPIALAYLTASWEWESIASTLWRRDGRRFYHRLGFPCTEPRGIRIQYRAGWELDTGPGELRDLVLSVVQSRYNAAVKGGLQSETLSDYSYTIKSDAELATLYENTVARWRRHVHT